MVLKDGEKFDDMYDHRSVLYEKYADIVIDENGSDIEGTIEKIIQKEGEVSGYAF